MTAVDFPDSPSLGQTFSVNNRTWIWTGTTWDAQVTPVGVAPGGTTNQVLVKSSNVDFATTWSNTVSSVIAGTGLTGGTITTTGTIAVDSNVVPLLTASQLFTGTQTFVVSDTSATPVVIKAISSQTGDLLDVKNSANTVIAKIDVSGNLLANTVGTLNGLVTIKEENSGGVAEFAKALSTPAAPGTDHMKLYVKDGSTVGTLKLAIRSGTSGDEVVLVDGIPQTSGLATSKLGVSIIEGGNA